MTSQSKDSLNFVDFFLDLVDLAEDFGLPVFNDLAVFCNMHVVNKSLSFIHLGLNFAFQI